MSSEATMVDLKKDPYGKYNGNELEYVSQVLNSDNRKDNEIPWTQRFEKKFCEVMGVKYAVTCNSGTSGLHSAIVAAGVQPGDEVICPGLAVIMDAYAILHANGVPVFADVNRNTQTIDPEDIEKKITSKTKAIIVVSLQGLPADMDPIMKMADELKLVVIEDSAQTMLGTYKGRLAGTLGHMGVFSFENKKHLTSGSEGGMIVTDDEHLAKRARKFAGIGYKHLTSTTGRTSLALSTVQDPNYERFDAIGLNYRMNEVSAAVGLAQLERVELLVERRREVAALFREAVGKCSWLVEQNIPEHYVHSHYTFSVQYFGHEALGLSWKDFYNKYLEMGGDGFYSACKVLYLEPFFREFEINGSRYNRGLCPIAEEIQPRIMQFKTNYRNLDIAKQKAQILKNLINSLS